MLRHFWELSLNQVFSFLIRLTGLSLLNKSMLGSPRRKQSSVWCSWTRSATKKLWKGPVSTKSLFSLIPGRKLHELLKLSETWHWPRMSLESSSKKIAHQRKFCCPKLKNATQLTWKTFYLSALEFTTLVWRSAIAKWLKIYLHQVISKCSALLQR